MTLLLNTNKKQSQIMEKKQSNSQLIAKNIKNLQNFNTSNKISHYSLSSVINSISSISKDKEEMITQNKIVINFNQIKTIGYDIPTKYTSSVTKLYLSNNKIEDLTGIEVFNKLTHISLQNNSIMNFEELLKLPLSIQSISVKGNFIDKDPNLYINLINRFSRLVEIDGFKISQETKNTINCGKDLKFHLIPLLSILEKLTHEAIACVNKIKINLELGAAFNLHHHTDYINEKRAFIKKLLEKLGIGINKNDYLTLKTKYLKSSINPSVYIIYKIFASVLKSKLNYVDSLDDNSDFSTINSGFITNDSKTNTIDNQKRFLQDNTFSSYSKKINKNTQEFKSLETSVHPKIIVSDAISNFFNEESRINISSLYSDLFANVIKKYVLKSNYNSLPAFLNYKVLKSNKSLESFILSSIRKDKNYFESQLISKFSEQELILYISKNLDKIFIRYTNKDSKVLTKLQLTQFYLLDPPSPEMVPRIENKNVVKNTKTNVIMQENN